MAFLRQTAKSASKAVYQTANEIKRRMSDVATLDMSPKARKYVGYWLLACSAGVYVAVGAGGLTRLQESAMKMTDRHPFRWLPPFGQKAWEEEFENYKKFDEYMLLTPEDRGELTLEMFKFKWSLVYCHRMGGRSLFFLFMGPCIYFWKKGYFNSVLKKRMLFAGLLMAAQIPIGWWMLNSGLHRELMANKEKPGVSQYRMATHLVVPFMMYGVFLYSGLSMFLKPQDHSNVAKIGQLRFLGKGLIAMLLVGSGMGCFLTALDAAEPEYARKWLPDDLFVMVPKWKNIFENPVTVQFIHRYLGYISFAVINATYFIGRRMHLHPRAMTALKGMMALGYAQLVLGVSTLYFRDPAILAWLHQNFSIILFTFLIWLVHEIRRLPK
uniref:Uncharacterized protein n=1 Tax=Panagrolaimus superbus TaxID=310955 RepID=A0A914XYP2_9BILA